VFATTGGAWSEVARLSAGDGAPVDGFGSAVSLSDGTVIVGAPSDDDDGTSSGSAYLITAPGLGDGCTVDDDCLSGFCMDDLCCDSACDGDCEACDLPGTVGTCMPAAEGAPCRPESGPCDAAETCDGVARDCPADLPAPDGTPCPDGSCQAGECTAGGLGGGGTGGSGGTAAAGSPPPEEDGGCGCRMTRRDADWGGWTLGLVGLAALRRRRRSA
jgi:MYXO-CTERM domain-containing protein